MNDPYPPPGTIVELTADIGLPIGKRGRIITRPKGYNTIYACVDFGLTLPSMLRSDEFEVVSVLRLLAEVTDD